MQIVRLVIWLMPSSVLVCINSVVLPHCLTHTSTPFWSLLEGHLGLASVDHGNGGHYGGYSD